MFYAPYKVEKHYTEYYKTFERKVWGQDSRKNTDLLGGTSAEGYWKWKKKKTTLYEWVEFHLVFAPPLRQHLEKETVGDNRKMQIITYKQQDYMLQVTMIIGELILVAMLFFLFKTKKA
jgi:hypothetical protein